MLLACNGILGLDEFVATQCTGNRCDGGADASNGDANAVSDAALDALGTAPVSWARWKMPNSPGDAAAENIASYKVASGDVLDKVSTLVWQQTPTTRGGMSFADAKTACPAGYRLPSRIELVTLLDLTQSPTIDKATFPATDASPFWTSSEVRPYGVPSRKRWVVDFSSGRVAQAEETGSASVRCIKSLP